MVGEELDKNLREIQFYNMHPQFQQLEARLQGNNETTTYIQILRHGNTRHC